MAQAMDAHSSFVYLVDHLPKWQATIDSLSLYTTEKNAEFAAEYARLLNEAKPKRKKTASMSSIHTADEREAVDDQVNGTDSVDALSLPDPRQINPLEAGNRYLYAQARRKRKPGPSIRSGASGPQKYRNRNHVVVFYDGYLQEQLDTMVKQLGLGRNSLRKGKNALAAATGFRLPMLSGGANRMASPFNDLGSTLTSRSTSALLPLKKPVAVVTVQPNSDEASFIQADKELEQVQSLCETAAHQFLRDGDCKAELGNIRRKLDALLVHATATAESLKRLQESHKALEADSSASDSTHVTDSDGTLSTRPSLDLLLTPKIGVTTSPSPLAISHHPLDSLQPKGLFSPPVIPTLDGINELTAETIEVDDTSDQESIVVDLSQYRLTNPRRSATRIPA
ncbi:hypothetical protein H2200_002979 [Cladophialophora chaetospira]|uniref:Uncharacterized protein n=1 Tax=Cladophialophora chaetospira TaxID=386627 RepID=A0AA39CMB1_9EURO|nr:hypothetical protein H2200_002979 [Cladophialophora chaetospira]